MFQPKVFHSPIMAAPDYLCLACDRPVYIWLEGPEEIMIGCSCKEPELYAEQVTDSKTGLLDGSLKLEEVF